MLGIGLDAGGRVSDPEALVYAAAAERARWRRLFLTRIEEVASMIAAVTAGTQRERNGG